jgi:Phosphomannose isomerase
MKKLYPIKFVPEPRERVWGGDYLVKKLKKDFDAEISSKKIGESWELWSLFGESSVIENGFLKGNTLDELIEIYLGDAIGEGVFNYYKGEFPLLIKILDIKDRLSVQVHPNDEIAMERENSFGKAEIWYVMDAEPTAKVYMGFKKDVTPTEFYERCKNETVEEIMNVYTPKKGDCIYIEPGCVHAAGYGLVIAEIQQSSDITYRLYDWGRENNPKTARKMDLEEAIDIIDYKKYVKEKFYFEQVTGSKMLVDNKHFIVKTLDLTEQIRIIPSLINSFIIYICTRGEAQFKMNNGDTYDIKAGETIFIPAAMEDFVIHPIKGNPMLLETYVPQVEDEDNYLNYMEEEDENHGCYKDDNRS